MDKKIIIAIAVAAVLLIIISATAGYFYWNNSKFKSNSILENAGDTAEKITDSAAKGILPSLETNPLKNKPDINPADKANPIKNIKTNPFE